MCKLETYSRSCKGKKKVFCVGEMVFPMGLLGHILIGTCHVIFHGHHSPDSGEAE